MATIVFSLLVGRRPARRPAASIEDLDTVRRGVHPQQIAGEPRTRVHDAAGAQPIVPYALVDVAAQYEVGLAIEDELSDRRRPDMSSSAHVTERVVGRLMAHQDRGTEAADSWEVGTELRDGHRVFLFGALVGTTAEGKARGKAGEMNAVDGAHLSSR